jgi:hypothetical protein
VVNHLLADFAESTERSKGSSDKNVLALGSIDLGEFNSLSRVDVEQLEVSLDIGVALFEVLKSLGDVFFELGDFGLYKVREKGGCIRRSS